MSDLLSRIEAALAGRYAIERELGRGGMAAVFLARDEKHRRPVAIKVLLPEIAAAVGADRFVREIAFAARLNHPHILPLHDSGEAGGLLYYVMPYVSGESLRQRLEAAGRLSPEQAVAIGRQIADALDHAHGAGIVHRDIKPENVLLSGGHAVVADFGVARAVEVAVAERRTATGIALGTPEYMSPEQAAGDLVDARSDIYALGCVLYEMLSGQSPFAGGSTRAVLMRRFSAPTARLPDLTVPPSLAATIERALAVNPADRFASAADMRAALDGEIEVRRPRRRISRSLIAVAATLLVASVALAALRFWPGTGPALDDDLIAVLPFRTSATDTSLAYLGEGIVDLMAVKLTGEGGPRAVVPRAVLSSWHHDSRGRAMSPADARRLATRFGAGRLVEGSVVGTGSLLSLTASIVDVRTGHASPPVIVEGSRDSVALLVDRLASRLLAEEAGIGRLRLDTLTSLTALRAYIDAEGAYRRGEYSLACAAYTRALEEDSAFVRGALGVLAAAYWIGGDCPWGRAVRLLVAMPAHTFGAREEARARAALALRSAGPALSWAELLQAAESLVELAPDDPEAWFQAADIYFHQGAFLDLPGHLQRAHAGFARSLDLDSSFTAPLEHLIEIALMTGDSAEARRLLRLHGTHQSSELAPYVNWRVQHAFGEDGAGGGLTADLADMDVASLLRVVGVSQLEGLELDDARRALDMLMANAATDDDRFGVLLRRIEVEANGGRPAATEAVLEELERTARGQALLKRIENALYWDGDTAIAAREVALVESMLASRDTILLGGLGYEVHCLLEQWRLRSGEVRATPAVVARLRQTTVGRRDAALCADVLEAIHAHLTNAADADRRIERLDSIMRDGARPLHQFQYYNIVVARLYEQRGRIGEARAAIRRREYMHERGARALSTFLREEGRLAALAGDTAGAVQAYTHYLTLRADPEPALRTQVHSVRAELARLVGEPRR